MAFIALCYKGPHMYCILCVVSMHSRLQSITIELVTITKQFFVYTYFYHLQETSYSFLVTSEVVIY